MKVNPSLFTTAPTTPPPSNTGAGEARRAFEAMLSAGAARTRVAQTPTIGLPLGPRQTTTQASSVEAFEADTSTAPLARPGRVLDIKV